MAYNPNNNPYVPGDPYSYDLKWIVQQIKDLLAATESLSEDIVDLRQYIDDYIAQLDIPQQVQDAIQQMIDDGDFDPIISDWISTHGVVLVDTDQSATFTAAQKAQARKNIAAPNTNPNLLDNPWNTVNQRNLTSGSFALNGYAWDRWAVSYSTGGTSTWLWTDGVIRVATAAGANLIIEQKTEGLAALDGLPLTLSIKMANGDVYSGTFIRTAGTAQRVNVAAGIELLLTSTDSFRIQIYDLAGTFSYRAVKLEVGEASTLAYDAPPNYQTELAKCQRFFVRSSFIIGQCIATGYTLNVNSLRFMLPLPTTLRTVPTVSYSGSFEIVGQGNYTSNVTTLAVSSTPSTYTGYIQLSLATTTNLVQYQIYAVRTSQAGTYIDISAEL